jgi:hypothetical protein
MADMLIVAAFQLGHPMILRILVETYDTPLHFCTGEAAGCDA